MNPTVSIIVPVYNGELFLKRCVDSILKQDYKDFELILAFYSDRIQEKSRKPLSEDLKFLLEMYCQGSIYMTVQWVFGRVKHTPEELAADLVKAMPEELAGVFEGLDLL